MGQYPGTTWRFATKGQKKVVWGGGGSEKREGQEGFQCCFKYDIFIPPFVKNVIIWLEPFPGTKGKSQS